MFWDFLRTFSRLAQIFLENVWDFLRNFWETNGTFWAYCNEDSRKKNLETICWSFQALCVSATFFLIFLMLPTLLEPAKPMGTKNTCPSTAYPITGSGHGRFPTHDPWGKEFTKDYNKDRWKLGGQKIAGSFKGCLEGIQGDQDYVRAMMTPARFWANKNSSKCFKHFSKSTNGAPSNFVLLCGLIQPPRFFLKADVLLLLQGPGLGVYIQQSPRRWTPLHKLRGTRSP